MEDKKELVSRFKELNEKVRSGKATKEEFAEAKKLARQLKGKRRVPEKDGKRVKSESNDISFYNKNPELLRDAANVIFNEIAGTEFHGPKKVAGTENISWPVVGATFTILPTIGKNSKANDPFNYQMRDLWLALHRAYRGVGGYEYADLGIAIYAIMHAFADIARAERIYGIASKFEAQNRSYPNAVLAALNLVPSAIAAEKLADFRYQINRCIQKAGVLCLPKGFSAFEVYIRLFGSIFKDSENVRAQWFLYDSHYRIDYDPTFTTGSSITYTKRTASVTTGEQTLDDIIADINTQLDNLLSDTDVARMCSDILKAFGENGIQRLLPLPEDFSIDVIADEVRKEQMHNTTLVGRVVGGEFSSTIFTALGSFSTQEETLRIYQEDGVVKQNLYSIDGSTYAPSVYDAGSDGYIPASTSDSVFMKTFNGDCALNTWKNAPSGDDVVEMTRQVVPVEHITASYSGTTKYSAKLAAYGIYVVTSVTFFNGQEHPAPSPSYIVSQHETNIMTYTNAPSASQRIFEAGQISRLDWAPRLDLVYVASGVPTSESMFWDLDNYSLISQNALRRLHDACNISVFKLSLSVRPE